MGKLELEVKILNIDEKEFIKKIELLGAIKKEEIEQFLYTYDLATIYGRYIDILAQLNEPESDIKYETSISKLKLLFFELDNLITIEDKEYLKSLYSVEKFDSIIEKSNLLEILNSDELIKFIKTYKNNSKKWIRLRTTKGKTTIAVKHILANNETNIQQMLETEIDVSNLEMANNFLESLGFSYKSYQEKRRKSYILDGYEIDIDKWPGIPTYVEVEGKDEKDLKNILAILGYKIEDTISCTADVIYEMNGLSHFDRREIKFDDYDN